MFGQAVFLSGGSKGESISLSFLTSKEGTIFLICGSLPPLPPLSNLAKADWALLM